MELGEAREVLGVDAAAEWGAVRLSYKRLALRLHPDKNPGVPGAVEAFARLRVAYDALEKEHLSAEVRTAAEEEEAERAGAARWREERMRARAAVNEALRAAAEEARLAVFEQARRRARANAAPPRPAVTAADEASVTVAWEPPDEHLFGAAAAYELQYCIVRCADGPMSGWAYVWRVASSALAVRSARKKNLLPAHAYVFRVRARAADGLWSQLSPPTAPVTTGEPPEDLVRPETTRPLPLRARAGAEPCELIASRCALPPERAGSGPWELQYRALRGLWMPAAPPAAGPLRDEQHALGGLHERASYFLRARARALPADVWSCWSAEVGPLGVRPPDGAKPRASGVVRSVGKALLAAGLRASAKPEGEEGAKAYADGSSFRGRLLCGLAQGEGELRLAGGAVCAGHFELDVLHGGAGTMLEPDGELRYAGEWQRGARHGRGEQTWGGGSGPYESYAGGWSEGLFHGQGTLTLRTGETYTGGWLGGQRSGSGEARVPASGEWYVGGWEGGRYSGKGHGRFVYPDGSVYEGETLNGARHGEGVLVVPPGEQTGRPAPGWTYKGRLQDDTPNGRGALRFDDGREHVGGFSHGRKHGKGRFSWPGGDFTEGVWEQGELVGDSHVRVSYANGDVYEGGMRAGSQHGEGTYTRKGGGSYKGGWRAGARHGWGRSSAPNGDWYEGGWEHDEQRGKGRARRTFPAGVYEGQLANAQMTGRGTFIWADGRKYEGEWSVGSQHGQGTFTDSDGDRYTGGFAQGAFHGSGRLREASGDYFTGEFARGERVGRGKARTTYASGDVYEGEVVGSVRSGHGTYTWRGMGDKYKGEWAADRQHGKGRLTKALGGVQEGTWDHGEFVG